MVVLAAALFLMFQAAPATALKGSIEGIVLKAGTKVPEPIPHARLELAGGVGNPLIARTDSAGRFLFKDLLPGRYRLSVANDGYVKQEYGQRNPNSPGAPITVDPGQAVKEIGFKMVQTGTIAGSVRDQDGEPMTNATIFAARTSFGGNGERLMSRQYVTRTNDRGEYRLFYMTPGDYFVIATYVQDLTGPVFSPPNVNLSPERPGYMTMYYPGTTEPAEAAMIRVDAGMEVGGIAFNMRRLPTVAVKGTVIDATNGRPSAAIVSLSPRNDTGVPRRYQANLLTTAASQSRASRSVHTRWLRRP